MLCKKHLARTYAYHQPQLQGGERQGSFDINPAGTLFDNISPVLVKNVRPLPDQVNAAVFCGADKKAWRQLERKNQQ